MSSVASTTTNLRSSSKLRHVSVFLYKLSVPRILIVCLKRFDANEKKLNNNVDFPFSFEFSQNNLTDELAKKE